MDSSYTVPYFCLKMSEANCNVEFHFAQYQKCLMLNTLEPESREILTNLYELNLLKFFANHKWWTQWHSERCIHRWLIISVTSYVRTHTDTHTHTHHASNILFVRTSFLVLLHFFNILATANILILLL